MDLITPLLCSLLAFAAIALVFSRLDLRHERRLTNRLLSVLERHAEDVTWIKSELRAINDQLNSDSVDDWLPMDDDEEEECEP